MNSWTALKPNASMAAIAADNSIKNDGGISTSGTGHDGVRRQVARHIEEDTTSRNILLFLIAFRILNALSIQTFFQPDEYFQSLEPAWQIAFGADSGAWITWVRRPPHLHPRS
jgi:phosphatidylinositol glycan class B